MGRSFYRPWSKVIGPITGNGVTEVNLTDSQGIAFPCNFISVECSSADGNGMIQLQASSISSGIINSETQLSGTGANASGFPGMGCTVQGGVAQLVLGMNDAVPKVQIVTYQTGDGVLCFVNYGNVMQGNTLKDNERPRGV